METTHGFLGCFALASVMGLALDAGAAYGRRYGRDACAIVVDGSLGVPAKGHKCAFTDDSEFSKNIVDYVSVYVVDAPNANARLCVAFPTGTTVGGECGQSRTFASGPVQTFSSTGEMAVWWDNNGSFAYVSSSVPNTGTFRGFKASMD
jgi:hypothetical protein